MDIKNQITKRGLALVLALITAVPLVVLAIFSRPEKKNDNDYLLSLGIVVDTSSSQGTKASQSITVAAVIYDSDGRIIDCEIDCAQSEMNVEGGMLSGDNTYLTKNELGQSYGMSAYSSIKKDWFEQADFFADYVEGMNINDLDIEIDDGGKPADADLLSGCTMGITDMEKALKKAVDNKSAVKFRSEKTPEASLACITDDSSSKAFENTDGVCSMETSACAIAVADSKALACIIDVAQPKIYFDSQGNITSSEFEKTKLELGYDYNMAPASPIGKEWFEQQAHFSEYIIGMTAEEIGAIKINDSGKADDADLVSGCTIYPGGFIAIAKKALENAG
ncbi:MAG: hypothetical protein E7575_03145 [Ruminococcaceae bacterium]|nr:hypothetical protein [Oscillospiraceae bacterium]